MVVSVAVNLVAASAMIAASNTTATSGAALDSASAATTRMTTMTTMRTTIPTMTTAIATWCSDARTPPMAGACSPFRCAVDGMSQIDIDRDPDDLSAPSQALRC